jgi:hypothetical protein
MNSITPEVTGCRIILVAADQPEFQPIKAAMVKHPDYPTPMHGANVHLLAFKPDAAELALLNMGEAIYVGLLTGGYSMTPLNIFIGKDEAAHIYGVEPVEADI